MIRQITVEGKIDKGPSVFCDSNNKIQIVKYRIVSERNYKDKDGKPLFDKFICFCYPFRQDACEAAQGFEEGDLVSVVGSPETETFKDSKGQTHIVTVVNVSENYKLVQ